MSLHEFNAASEGHFNKWKEDSEKFRIFAFMLYRLGGGKMKDPRQFMPFDHDEFIGFDLTADVIAEVNKNNNRPGRVRQKVTDLKAAGRKLQEELRNRYKK